MCHEGDNTLVGINIPSTQMNWIILMRLQEIISGFSLEFISMSSFVTTAMWSYGIWAYSLLPINKY